jgi:hypothetical protein
MKNQIIPAASPKSALAPVQSDRPGAPDVEGCAERASEALAYLARHYPESAGSAAFHFHQDAAYDAVVSCAGEVPGRAMVLYALRPVRGAEDTEGTV